MTVKIPLSIRGPKYAGKFSAIVDECDYDLASVSWTVKVPIRSRVGKTQYAYRMFGPRVKPQSEFMHNAIAERHLGTRPEGMVTDHLNFDGLDNRRSNLQYLNVAENCRRTSMRVNNTSGIKGVSFCKRNNSWKARATVKGKRVSFGYHDTKEMAEQALIMGKT